MKHDNKDIWSYLSPSRPGWWLVAGVRGRVRRILAEYGHGDAGDDPLLVVLHALHLTDRLLRIMEQDVLVLVTEAHHRGASWSDIAARLYRTKQSVHQRYQRLVYASRTRAALRDDCVEAARRAQVLCRQGDPEEVRESTAFLRDRSPGPPATGWHHRG